MQEDSKTFVRYNHEPNRKESLTDSNVFSIAESSQTDELLISTFGGLNILKDEQAGIFENPFSYPHEGDQFHFTLVEDKEHNLWVGARSGLSIYSLETKQSKHTRRNYSITIFPYLASELFVVSTNLYKYIPFCMEPF